MSRLPPAWHNGRGMQRAVKPFAVLLAGMFFAVAPLHAQDSGDAVLDNPAPPVPVLERPGRQHAGAGVVLAPRYPGAGSYRLRVLPDLRLRWGGRFFLDTRNGLGLYLLENERYAFGASIHVRPGRDEDDAPRLNGLGDIDTAAQARLFGRAALGRLVLGAAAGRDLGASEGATVDVSAALPYRMSAEITLTPALSARYSDSKYTAAWFGVSAAQSQRSGLPVYRASSGFTSTSALLAARYRINARVSLNLFAGVVQLLGDAADSPLVEEDAWAVGGVTLQYEF